MRKICVVTGTRADYGLLKSVMQGIRDSSSLRLQLVVTGSHLCIDFGLTYKEIELDGFYIDRKISILTLKDMPVDISIAIGRGVIGFAKSFAALEPDLIVVLGDRYEILAAATAALVMNIPIAHLHGGELTEGAFDDAIRHSVTKMSHLHFVATEIYRNRVLQLGEDPKRIYLTGGLGVDALHKVTLLDRVSLESSMDFKFGKRNLMVTYHPPTLETGSTKYQLAELLRALHDLDETHIIFTLPNADPGSRDLMLMLKDFCVSHPNAQTYTSLGQQRYLSCIAQVDGVVGNSSSGIAEVPSFFKGTINIGDRQKGRLKATSIIDCSPDYRSIGNALNMLYSSEFQKSLANTRNPYGEGGASQKIVDILTCCDLSNLTKKSFFDFKHS
jgi:GDP/UDP-N,N'-diacetylbacillosamine 2-epimerase (hydrolysing)